MCILNKTIYILLLLKCTQIPPSPSALVHVISFQIKPQSNTGPMLQYCIKMYFQGIENGR